MVFIPQVQHLVNNLEDPYKLNNYMYILWCMLA